MAPRDDELVRVCKPYGLLDDRADDRLEAEDLVQGANIAIDGAGPRARRRLSASGPQGELAAKTLGERG